MKKKFILLMLLCLPLLSKNITLEFLKNKPSGVVRDFYIWQFIQDPNTSTNDAKNAYELVTTKSPTIQKAMEKKGIAQSFQDLRCKNLAFDLLKNEDAQCISYGLKLSIIKDLIDTDIQLISQKLIDFDVALVEQIQILRSKNILEALLKTSAKNFGIIFNALTYTQKLKIFDTPIPPQNLEILANQNNATFNSVLRIIILDSRFEVFKQSLLKANITQSDPNTFFLLGINELLGTQNKRALEYFKRSFNSATDPFLKDRALFWQYLMSKDISLLNELAQSKFVDIFSIYASQKLDIKPAYHIVSTFENLSKKEPEFDISDPFEWEILRNNIFAIKDEQAYKSALQHFRHQKSIPQLVYFLNRLYKYQINYFITPYEDLIAWKNDNEKSMVYAIARQESHLLPALISRSYALGTMQIMPFNVAPFAEEIGQKNITLFDMFDPKTSLTFGKHYLNYLKKEFVHPLFVAYAYNGGPGFLRRLLEKNKLFIKGRDYEPWLSMELIPYEESRFYGMKVLANYVIYQELFGHHINLEDFLAKTLVYSELPPKEQK